MVPRHRRSAAAMAPVLALLMGLAAGCDQFDSDPTSPGPPGPPPGPVNCLGTDYPDWQSSPYVLPYPVGQAYVVLQGNCTNISHGGDIRFAYDFTMPIGSAVTAARSGRVETVVNRHENFNGRRRGENIVVILHPDGTLARYAHLDKGGALVEVGDMVRQGEIIGRSGASNLDPGNIEHLHFHVQIRGGRQTLATTFRNTTPNPNGLVVRTLYEAERYTPDDQ